MLRMLVLCTAATAATIAQQPAAPPPSTDIYELSFDGTLAGFQSATLRPVSTARGYDNQPCYTPDGEAILFTANRDGKQMDIYELNRKSRAVRAIIATPEGEYSPAVTPDGTGISVIRVEADSTQRLWRFDRNGANPRLVLNDIKPVGYHAWIDADQLALFVLGQPATLQHARVSTGKATGVAQNIGRSILKIPASPNVSFIHRQPAPKEGGTAEVWVKQFEPASGAVTPLVRVVPGSDEPYTAWMPDGTLLMSAGTNVFAWRRGEKEWREVYDAARQMLGVVTRMAVAPDGKALAIVVNEPK